MRAPRHPSPRSPSASSFSMRSVSADGRRGRQRHGRGQVWLCASGSRSQECVGAGLTKVGISRDAVGRNLTLSGVKCALGVCGPSQP